MKQSVAAIFFVIFAICMIIVVMHLFPVGDPRLPAYGGLMAVNIKPPEDIPVKADSVALRYNRMTASDVGASSVVCAVILDYRAYDTLYECTVLYAAAIAVLSIIGKSNDNA